MTQMTGAPESALLFPAVIVRTGDPLWSPLARRPARWLPERTSGSITAIVDCVSTAVDR
jgi:hypothetical protein